MNNQVKEVIVGSRKPADGCALGISFDVNRGDKVKLLARGNNTGKAVNAANIAASLGLVVRPTIALVKQESIPGRRGHITVLEVPLYETGDTAPVKPQAYSPVIIGLRDSKAYAIVIRRELLKGKPVVVRARFEPGITKALNAACFAANLGFCNFPTMVAIGEEKAQGGKLVPYVEIVLHAASAAPAEAAS